MNATTNGLRVGDLIRSTSGKPDLFLFSAGFFLYPTDRDFCAAIAAPRIDLAPHAPLLAIPEGSVLEVSGPLKSTVDIGFRFFELSGLSMSVAGKPTEPAVTNHDAGAGPDVPDFQWITDFTTLCSGVQLDPAWSKSPALEFVFQLSGGQLAALADSKSLKETWRWTLNGVARAQHVTSLTTYSTEFPDLMLQFARLDGTAVGTLRLRPLPSDSFVVGILLNQPKTPPTDDTGALLVQYAHDVAMLNLCLPAGGPIQLATPIKKSKVKTGKKPMKAPKSGSKSIDTVLEFIETRFTPFWDGTPECSGHQMP